MTLTGIRQEMIDGKPSITECLHMADEWIKSNKDLTLDSESNPINFIFLTCGDWDLKTMLPSQCKFFNIKYPNYFTTWINIKKSFAELTGHFPKGMPTMLQMLNLNLEGRHHSGIDDCRNIAKIAKEMAQRGFIFEKT
ncbi:ERI1 exoribonuclease 3-like [Brachionus plicatilis]|uniref:ERI1 exoribonuclease 3-like n=1 Tax=Brachionus plicatilis TaxID=10195 RepID=A0A3M7R3B4_BRAPC|nr:ERI1 exoribonuclease 3-like [Brachionus plicatilis]